MKDAKTASALKQRSHILVNPCRKAPLPRYPDNLSLILNSPVGDGRLPIKKRFPRWLLGKPVFLAHACPTSHEDGREGALFLLTLYPLKLDWFPMYNSTAGASDKKSGGGRASAAVKTTLWHESTASPIDSPPGLFLGGIVDF